MPKEKIAILGAGVGSMTAAFEITSQPNWQDKYDITIYQLGWRAGGKGASGRNHQIADRIQEHGLHVWMGFYENAFEMIRQAYEYCAQNNLTPGTPFPSYRDAFTKMSFDPVTEQVNEVWKIWPIFWSPNDDIPGQANPTDAAPPVDGTLWGYIRAIVDTVRGHLDRLIDGEPLLQGIIDNLVDDILEAAEGNDGGGHDTLLHRIASFVHSLPIDSAAHTDEQHNLLLAAIVRLVELVFHHLESLAEENDEIRRFLIVADTAFGFVHGIIADDIMENGFAAIEKEDFVDWLARNNCRSAKSALTRGMYDGAFAYEDGDRMKPRAAAGSILHGSLRLMFTYRGSFMWFMNAGMGDVVFTPLYKALRHRGVKFEFFRKVTRLAPSPDGAVDSIEMNIQAHVRPELAEYDPLVPVKGLLCWPAEPRYEQLVEASILQDPKFVNRDLESWWTDLPTFGSVSLKRGVDFDRVILGISLGALPYICKDLAAADRSGAWQGMFDNIKTVRTQAFQLWLNKTKEELGWNPGRTDDPVLCGYLEPFDTWGDETHLLPRENWPPSQLPKQNPYFCNAAPADPWQAPFTDPTYPATQLAIVTQNAVNYLNDGVGLLWPQAVSNQQFDWTLLVNPLGTQPPINSQWIRVNIDPSELYVLSVPGSTQFRLLPWDSRFSNLILAGDWTLNDVNLGCVEAAAESGKMASFALTGTPDFIYGSYRKVVPMKDIQSHWQVRSEAEASGD